MTPIETIIAAHPFTAEFAPRFLPLLSAASTLDQFTVEETVFQEGSVADRFYLVHRGCVALETFVPGKGATTIQTVSAGEALGWSWLFPPYRWHFGAVAIEPVEVVAFSAETLRQHMATDHEFGYAMAMRVNHLLQERLQATRLRLLEMYAPPA